MELGLGYEETYMLDMGEFLELYEVYKRRREREVEDKTALFQEIMKFTYRLIAQHAVWLINAIKGLVGSKSKALEVKDLIDFEKIDKTKEDQIKIEEIKEEYVDNLVEDFEKRFEL